MSSFSNSTALAVVAIIAAVGCGSFTSASAQPADSVDTGVITGILRAKSLADVIHGWHENDDWPPDDEYCRKYKDGDKLYNQLRQVLGNPSSLSSIDPKGISAGLPNSIIIDAARKLGDELDEEDGINDEWGHDPCWPPFLLERRLYSLSNFSGFYVGAEFMGNWGKLGITEMDRFNNAVTNQFDRSGKRDGFGFQFGYKFAPWNNGVTVNPFVSTDFFDQTIRQSFPNTTYLGTATNWALTTGVKIGYDVRPDVNIYSLGGATFLNQKAEINFGGPITSETKTVPGLALGIGAEYKPSFLQGYGVPVSVYAQYQHTWYKDVHLDNPTASPGFNYAFQRSDNIVKLGVNFYPSLR